MLCDNERVGFSEIVIECDKAENIIFTTYVLFFFFRGIANVLSGFLKENYGKIYKESKK